MIFSIGYAPIFIEVTVGNLTFYVFGPHNNLFRCFNYLSDQKSSISVFIS